MRGRALLPLLLLLLLLPDRTIQGATRKKFSRQSSFYDKCGPTVSIKSHQAESPKSGKQRFKLPALKFGLWTSEL